MPDPLVTVGLFRLCLPLRRSWRDGGTTTVVDHHTGKRPKDRSQPSRYTVLHWYTESLSNPLDFMIGYSMPCGIANRDAVIPRIFTNFWSARFYNHLD